MPTTSCKPPCKRKPYLQSYKGKYKFRELRIPKSCFHILKMNTALALNVLIALHIYCFSISLLPTQKMI